MIKIGGTCSIAGTNNSTEILPVEGEAKLCAMSSKEHVATSYLHPHYPTYVFFSAHVKNISFPYAFSKFY